MQGIPNVTLDALLDHRAASQGERLAYTHDGAALTYAQLNDDAGALAAALARAGVAPGDRVALHLPAGLDFVRAFWAVQRLGAVSCAFNPQVPRETAVQRVARIRPRLLLVANRDPELADAAMSREIPCLAIADLPRAAPLAPRAGDPDGVAYLQSTSGTSGEPRAAILTHRNVVATQESGAAAMGISERDVLVTWVPPWHDLGLVRFIIGSVFNGAVCHIVTPSIRTIPHWLVTIGKVRGTITGAPDFAYRLAAGLVDPRAVDLSSLRFATSGGEPVRQSTIAAFESRFGLRGVMLPGYGLAEATLGVSSVRPGEGVRTDERGNVSCGRPLPDVEVRIDDSEILVRSPGVFQGYFDADEASREVLRDGWLHTGDLGHFDDDGELYILGRRRAMLKRGGAILAPREVEEAAQQVPDVKIAAAVGIASEHRATEEIVVAVETSTQRDGIAEEVSQSVERALGFAPERVVVLPPRSIPRTSNGKIRHDALRRSLSASIRESAR